MGTSLSFIQCESAFHRGCCSAHVCFTQCCEEENVVLDVLGFIRCEEGLLLDSFTKWMQHQRYAFIYYILNVVVIII